MKRILRFSSIILLAIIFLPGCGKYDEGPDLTFKSKKDRLTNTWIVAEVFVNGEIRIDLPPEYINFVFKLNPNQEAQVNYVQTDGNTLNGEWEFYNDKCNFRVKVMALGGPEILSEFKIRKLKSHQLWVVDLDTQEELRLIPNTRF